MHLVVPATYLYLARKLIALLVTRIFTNTSHVLFQWLWLDLIEVPIGI